MITVAMLVTDAQKSAVETLINEREDTNYLIGFIRKVCPLDPAPTWETPHTHWYMNDERMTPEDLEIIQSMLPIEGLTVFIAHDAENSLAWAHSNMASQGLQFLPDEPI